MNTNGSRFGGLGGSDSSGSGDASNSDSGSLIFNSEVSLVGPASSPGGSSDSYSPFPRMLVGDAIGGVTSNQQAKGPSVNLQRFETIVNNILQSRSQFLHQLIDPRRDIEAECGHPREPVDPGVYQDLFDRFDAANRAVEVLPKESWQVTPSVYEVEDGEVLTAFEEGIKEFIQRLQGEDNLHIDEETSILWDILKKADIESGIGHYGVIILGLEDGTDPSQPARYKKGQKVAWVQVYPESMARIKGLDDGITSPRFGQPLAYEVTFNDPRSQPYEGVSSFGEVRNQEVHWTRVIHISQGVTFHAPWMRPILNRLLDLKKLYGASAEMYWRGAFPGISFETDPSLGGEVNYDPNAMRDSVENYFNGLQRYFALNGFKAHSLAPQVVDPSPQINAQITAICIKLGIPKRVFMGSERGELASSQDDAAWNDRLRERQKYITSKIVAPFFNRLIKLGVIPKPEKGYHIWWPDLTSQTDEEKSSVALKLMQSLAQYVSSGGDAILTPFDFFNIVWKLSEKEALNVVKRAEKRIEELGLPEFGSEPEPIPGAAGAANDVPPGAENSNSSTAGNGSGNGKPNNVSQMPNDSPSPSKTVPRFSNNQSTSLSSGG